MNKKILLGSIIAVVILLIASFPMVMSNEGKSDLVIEDIIIRTGTMPGDQIFYCWVKNIGDAKTDKGIIEIYTTVRFKLFGILPLSTVFSKTTPFGVGYGLYPGESANLSIVTDCELPKFGTYGFYCTVNPNMEIEEYNYSNNRHSEVFHVLFGYWF